MFYIYLQQNVSLWFCFSHAYLNWFWCQFTCPPRGSPVAQMVESAWNAGDYPLVPQSFLSLLSIPSIPQSRRSPGEGYGHPLHYSCLENPMYRGVWRAIRHRVAKSRTQLKDFTFTFYPLKSEIISFKIQQKLSVKLSGLGLSFVDSFKLQIYLPLICICRVYYFS